MMKSRSWTLVFVLRLFWLSVIFWYEIGVFQRAARSCNWPDERLRAHSHSHSHSGTDHADITHALLVADPQLLDDNSYPGRSPFLSTLTVHITDLFLRKAWHTTLSVKPSPDVVFFLGDMLDTGRSAATDEAYEVLVSRFRSIFKLPSNTPMHFLPGNHDVGLGTSSNFSPDSQHRFKDYFGPLNQRIDLANHTIVMIDAPMLVQEEYKRARAGVSYADWDPPWGGTTDFLKELVTDLTEEQPVILLTHIPLHRPDGASCGPRREKGTIRPGIGYGYQNTLSPDASEFLLEWLRPVAIFSGDDHDYCEYTHTLMPSGDTVDYSTQYVREVTLKSVSMAMGVRKPGFQRLSLLPHDHAHSVDIRGHAAGFADELCLLPDQISIYLYGYVPLILLTIGFVIFAEFKGWKRVGHITQGSPRRSSLTTKSRQNASPTPSARGRQPFRFEVSPTVPAFAERRAFERNIARPPSPSPSMSLEKNEKTRSDIGGPTSIYKTHVRRISGYSHFSPPTSDSSPPSKLSDDADSDSDTPVLPLYNSASGHTKPTAHDTCRLSLMLCKITIALPTMPTLFPPVLSPVLGRGGKRRKDRMARYSSLIRVLRTIYAVAWPAVVFWVSLAVWVVMFW